MEVFDETTGVEDGWGQDEKLDTGNSMRAPSGGSDTSGTSGSEPSAAQNTTQARAIEGSQAATIVYPTEDEEVPLQWKAQGKPLGLRNSTITREQQGPQQVATPQHTSTVSSRMEIVGLDIETSGQDGQVGSSNRPASHPHRKTTKDFCPGQDSMQNAGSGFKLDSFTGPELFHGAHHIDIQAIEFTIHNHSPSANEVLSTLENPIGTSWDPARACLTGTRTKIIQDAVDWLSTVPTTGTAGLYVIADAVGTGKSSLAHTVAGEVHDAGYLAASFFFDQRNGQLSTTRLLFGALVRGLCSANEQAQDVAVKILRKDSMLAKSPPARQFDYLLLPICQAFPQGQSLAIIIDALDEGFDEDLMAIFRDRIPHLPPNVRIMVTTRPEYRIMRYLDPARQSHIHRCPHPLSGASNSSDVERYIEYELRGRDLGLTTELKTDFVQKSKGLFLWAAAVLKHLQDAHDPVDELTQILDAGGSEYWLNDADAGHRLDALFDRVIANLNPKDSKLVATYTNVVGALVTAKEPLSSEALQKLLASLGVSLAEILDILSRIQSLLDNFDPNLPQKPILFLHLSVRHYLTERAPHPFRLNPSEHHPVLCYAALEAIDQETNLDTFPFLGFSKDMYSPCPTFGGNQILQYLHYAYKFLIDHLVNSKLSDLQPACIDLLGHVLTSKGRELLEATAMMQPLLDVGRLRTWALEVFRDDQAPLRIIHAADGEFGKALHDVGRWLLFNDMAPVALMPIKTYTEMCRLLPAGSVRSRDLNKRRLALSLISLAKCQMMVGDRNSCVVAIEEALPIWRGLDASNRMKHTHNRAKYKLERLDILRNLCKCLRMAKKDQEAVEAARELVKIGRQLMSKNPNLYEPDLARTLLQLSGCLMKVQDHGPALTAAEESVKIHRRLLERNTGEHEALLSDARFFFRGCLVNVEKDQALAEAAEGLVEMGRQRTSKILNLYGRYIAKNLIGLPKRLTKVEDHGPALAAAGEGLQIHRRLFGSNPTEYDHEIGLASAVTTFRDCLIHAGKNQEAVEAAKELVEVVRQLRAKNPNLYERYLAQNLQTLSECLTKIEDHGPALAAAQESLPIYRQLFASNPAEYEIRLSDALLSFRNCLVNVEKHQEAAEAAKEQVETVRQLTAKNSNLYEIHLAPNLRVLSECLTKIEDYGPALAAAQESLQIYRRLFASNPAEYETWLADALLAFRVCLTNVEKHQEAAEAAKESVETVRQFTAENTNLYDSRLAYTLGTLSQCLTKIEDHGPALAAAQDSLQIYRRLFASHPTDCEIDLSNAVFTFRNCLLNAGKNQEAVEAAKELVKMNRQLASKYPHVVEEPLPRSLVALSECLTKVNDLPAALVTVQEAVALYRKLSCQDKAKHRAALEDSLALQNEILSQLQDDSVESAEAIPEVDVEMKLSTQA